MTTERGEMMRTALAVPSDHMPGVLATFVRLPGPERDRRPGLNFNL